MNTSKYILAFILTIYGMQLSASEYCHGKHETFHDDNLQRDFLAIQNFVNSKRTIHEKFCNLTLSGDIRAVWATLTEKGHDGHALRTSYVKDDDAFINTSGLPVPDGRFGTRYSQNVFSTDFNFYVDYTCERAWAVSWIEFDNIAGVQQSNLPCMDGILQRPWERLPPGVNPDPQGAKGSGCCDDLCLRKAYMGYNLWIDDNRRIDIEIGRRPLFTIFDSLVQFQNRFDGILFRYSALIGGDGCLKDRCCPPTDFYLNVGAFVIDERVNHGGWVFEMGLLDILRRGLDLKYSFINWSKKGTNRCGVSNPFGWKYNVSQVTFRYTVDENFMCINEPIRFYGAALYNHTEDTIIGRDIVIGATEIVTNYGSQNFAWYIGMTLNQICVAGDWMLDVNYQYVQANVVPDNDISGISNGNTLQNTLTQNLFAHNPPTNNDVARARGRGNYKGWRFDAMYAITDNLLFDINYEFSNSCNQRIGGKHNFSQFEMQTIYAF